MSKIRSIKQITDNRFLNYFELEAQAKDGHVFPYYMASRSTDQADLRMNRPDRPADGVAIFAVYGEKRDRVVLIRQYRFPLGGYIYEFPAGLSEKGEDPRETAVRELREETGLLFSPIDADRAYERGFFTTIGLTDETCAMVFGTCSGQVSLDLLEASEELEVVLADRTEAARILREENVALICAYMLMHFIREKEDPLEMFRKLPE